MGGQKAKTQRYLAEKTSQYSKNICAHKLYCNDHFINFSRLNKKLTGMRKRLQNHTLKK
jgi:hypothetical protein